MVRRRTLGMTLATALLGSCSGTPSKTPSPPSFAPPAVVAALAPFPFEPFSPAGDAARGPVMALLEIELARAMKGLSASDAPPHFLAYQVVDREVLTIEARDGAVVVSDRDHRRTLDVDLRVGDRTLDNTHSLPDEDARQYDGVWRLPLEHEPDAIKNAVWLATESAYADARAAYARVQRARSEVYPDRVLLSVQPPEFHHEPVGHPVVDVADWERRLRALSRVALEVPTVPDCAVSLHVIDEVRQLVSSEGTSVQQVTRHARFSVEASAVSEDGMWLERTDAVDVRSLERMPGDAELARRVRAVLADIQALRGAPVIEPYVGPAILDGRAAGVFFHEVFGHRVEGHRQDDEREGQTFSHRVEERVMPAQLTVYDDPTLFSIDGVELNGTYAFDDEGVRAKRAALVDQGVLRGFLFSRAPSRGFLVSNGHGRRQPGYRVVARQANLVVQAEQSVSREALGHALIEEVRRQGLPYGLRFREIAGGYTHTQRDDTQAFKVIPVLVNRVYPDGREELVRGVDIEGTPLTALSKIIGASDDYSVFNGSCGAESGWVPVSATSPSVLVSQIEVARRELGRDRPPALSPPDVESTPGASP